MSGRGPGRCCTSTWPSWRVFDVPPTASPPTAQRRLRAPPPARVGLPALRSRRPLPLRLCRTAPGKGRRHRGRGAGTGDRALPTARALPARGGTHRQRARLHQVARLQRGARERPPHHQTALHTTLERKRIERFIRTQAALCTSTHLALPQHRSRALGSFLRYYNRRRPHSSLKDRPPISRIHNLCGQDT